MGELIGLVAVAAPFLMVIGIVWLKQKSKLEEKRIEATAEASSEKAAQYASRTAELEQRVAVLERIVTDRGYDIATQIEALRDTRQHDESGAGVPLEIKAQEKA